MAPVTLLDLPTELLLQIASYLHYPFHLALFMTCRTLHSTIPNPNNPSSSPNGIVYPLLQHPLPRHHSGSGSEMPRNYGMVDLLHIELWHVHFAQPLSLHLPGPDDFFACRHCLRIRPALAFDNKMIEDPFHKPWPPDRYGSGMMTKANRFCIPCGVQRGRYMWGTELTFGGRGRGLGNICRRCVGFVGFMRRGQAVHVWRIGRHCPTCLDVKAQVGDALVQYDWAGDGVPRLPRLPPI